MTVPANTFCPYKGLQPYTEADCQYFFGRTRDQEIIISNLYASPLTVFYGASGVGKSSVLLAGVVPSLREEPRTAAVVVFNSWQSEDFLTGLKNEVAKQAGTADNVAAALPLDDFLAQTQHALGLPLFLIFDQFEEYFLYHPPGPAADAFEAEFARAVNRRNVEVNFLLSLREDGLSKLDRFQGRLPKLLNNMLRLEHLDRDCASEAITEPLRVYNQDPANSGRPMAIEPALVEKLLDELQAKNVLLEQTGEGQLGSGQGQDQSKSKIETSVLQMVLTRLWQEELAKQSATLRLQTFQDLGGTKEIARTHLDREMQKLNAEEQQAAASVLRYLVTPSGAKIAQQPSSLVEWTGLPEGSVYGILKKLGGPEMRILRKVEAPGQPEQFEVFHDVLARAILGWRAGYEDVQRTLRAERQVAIERAQERAQLQKAQAGARRWRWGVLGLSAVLLVMVALAIIAYVAVRGTGKAKEETSRALASFAADQLQHDPQQSMDLAVQALDVAYTPQAEQALRDAFNRSHVRLVISKLGAVRDVAFSPPDGKYLATAHWDKGARVWDVATGKSISTLGQEDPKSEVRSLAFSADGQYVITASGKKARVWGDWATGAPREVASLEHSSDVWSVAFSPDGQHIAMGDGTGSAYVWEFRPLAGDAVQQPLDQSSLPRDAVGTSQVKNQLPGKSGVIYRVVFSPNGEDLLLANRERLVQVWTWNDATGKEPVEVGKGVHQKLVYSAAFSHDGNYIVTACDDTRARVWEWRTEAVRPLVTLQKGINPMRDAMFSPDDKVIATVSDNGVVRLWDWRSWAKPPAKGIDPIEMRGHTDIVFSVDFNPGGDAIATGSEDQSLRFWKTQLDPAEAQGPINDLVEKARKQLPPNPGR